MLFHNVVDEFGLFSHLLHGFLVHFRILCFSDKLSSRLGFEIINRGLLRLFVFLSLHLLSLLVGLNFSQDFQIVVRCLLFKRLHLQVRSFLLLANF